MKTRNRKSNNWRNSTLKFVEKNLPVFWASPKKRFRDESDNVNLHAAYGKMGMTFESFVFKCKVLISSLDYITLQNKATQSSATNKTAGIILNDLKLVLEKHLENNVTHKLYGKDEIDLLRRYVTSFLSYSDIVIKLRNSLIHSMWIDCIDKEGIFRLQDIRKQNPETSHIPNHLSLEDLQSYRKYIYNVFIILQKLELFIKVRIAEKYFLSSDEKYCGSIQSKDIYDQFLSFSEMCDSDVAEITGKYNSYLKIDKNQGIPIDRYFIEYRKEIEA